MTNTTDFLARHGPLLLFGNVLLEQLGLPIPAMPLLLAAGALAAAGEFNLYLALALSTTACLIGDTSWFYLGRYRGNQVLGLLCRISLEPDSCVRRTQDFYGRHGLRGVALAKFLPGFNTVAPPLAGMSGVRVSHFLLADGVGAFLYGSCFIMLGFLFSRQIERITGAISSIGGSAGTLLVVVIAAWIGFKYWQRRRLLRELNKARVTVDELRRRQQEGDPLVVLDVRSTNAIQEDPAKIPGALKTTLDEIKTGRHDFPRDREVVVYCSCPNEESAARVTLLLKRGGFTRVRPLLGGIDAWRGQNYPLESFAPVQVVATVPPAGN